MSLKLLWNNEQTSSPIEPALIALLECLLTIAGEQEQIDRGEVSVSFVTDEAIQNLNRQFRGLDKPTDVLSFPMRELGYEEMEIVYDPQNPEADDLEMLGDIVISIPRALAQSEEYNHSAEREIGFLFVHGFLHLIGYDHEGEAGEGEMFALQEQILLRAELLR